MRLKECLIITTALVSLAITGQSVRAAEPAVNPAGTWKVTLSTTNTTARPGERTLKLKLDGTTLTGPLSSTSTANGKSRVYDWPIKDARLQGSEISFTVTHPFQVGRGVETSRYQGKIEGEAMKGTVKIEFSGHAFVRDWQAERVKE